jgi:hypothetical protein
MSHTSQLFRHGLILVLLAGLAGCEEPAQSPEPPPQATPDAKPAAKGPSVEELQQIRPDYSIEIVTKESDPPQYEVVWTAKVPTGGWTMTTDSALVEDSMGKTSARIYVTLEQPGPDEMTTQAQETVTGRHDAGTTKVDKAELHVRRHIRGIKYDTPALYGNVARAEQ